MAISFIKSDSKYEIRLYLLLTFIESRDDGENYAKRKSYTLPLNYPVNVNILIFTLAAIKLKYNDPLNGMSDNINLFQDDEKEPNTRSVNSLWHLFNILFQM